MDSIERMRRINDLTRELKQRGFAESSFEAIKQANQIYGNDDLEDHVKHGLIKSSQNDKMSGLTDDAQAKDDTMGDDSVPYNDRKLAKISENVQVLTDKMNEIIRAINDLDARISDLKSRQDKQAIKQEPRPEPHVESRDDSMLDARKIRSEPVQEKPVPSANKQDAQPEQAAETHAQPKDEYSVNQRTGNFQSQDVAIDKMFYFGNKK